MRSDEGTDSETSLVQTKAFTAKIGPRYIRELEGSFAGAPAHWHGKGVMGFLVAPSEATKGMRDAMIASKSPLGFIQVSRDGRITQMLWNQQANFWGLEQYAVTTKFGDGGKKKEVVMTRNGSEAGSSEEKIQEIE